MTDLEREAREAAREKVSACFGEQHLVEPLDLNAQRAIKAATYSYLAAAALREQEIERLRAKLDEAKSAIRWMHGYDEPGTEDFPFCPEGKRFAWRSVARQQFAIVREACAEPIPLPEPKA